MSKFVLSLALLAFLSPSFCPSIANAQVQPQQRERRRAFVNELLKTLIESQMDRDPVPVQPGRPNLRPAFPKSGHTPSQPLTPNMVSARGKLQAWEAESNRFVDMLRREEQRVPRVRPLLADALSVSAQIKTLRRNAGRVHSLDSLTDSFCRIDSSWRLLSHQLSQVNGLRPECVACMGRMSQFDNDLCGLFRVEPQFNRRELATYCTQMASSFQHLIQDVRYDMVGDPQYGAIMGDCQRLYARLNESGKLIERGSYDSIVRIYKQSVNDWRNLKYKLVDCPHGRIQRNVHQIESIGAHIAELLWLPAEIDRRYLAMVLNAMERDIDLAFQQITLKDILASGKPGMVLASARDFANQCGSFSTRLKSNADIDSLLWDYKQFSNQWRDLEVQLRTFGNPQIRRAMGQVDSGFQVLQGVFGDGPLIDRYAMNEICADLDQLSYRLNDVIERRTSNGYDQRFRTQICDLSRTFRDCIHEMHDHAIQNRRHDANASQDVAIAINAWTQLRPLLNQCKPADRQQLRELRGRIEPLMVKLQVVFAG